jgi:hypothetical protein
MSIKRLDWNKRKFQTCFISAMGENRYITKHDCEANHHNLNFITVRQSLLIQYQVSAKTNIH